MAESLLVPLVVGATTAVASRALAPKMPKPSAPLRMPDPQSPEVIEARKRKVADVQARSGRESTMLADDSYSNTLLGD